MKHMLTPLLVAGFLLIASTVLLAETEGIRIEISQTGNTVFLTSARQVEAIKLTITTPGIAPGRPPEFDEWGVFVEKPALVAGQRTAVYLPHPARSVEIASIAFADGTLYGTPDAQIVLQARDQIRAGGPVDALEGENAAQLIWLLREYKRLNPTLAAPEVRQANPNLGYPWFVQGSMFFFGNMNGVPIPYAPDGGGNPSGGTGCWYSCWALLNLKASCPPLVGVRPSINASGSGGLDCPGGYMYVLGNALYGNGGMGGTFDQRYGMDAYVSYTIDGQSVQGQVIDSCGFSSPKNSGGFGLPCN